MLHNLSSAAVMIGALRVKFYQYHVLETCKPVVWQPVKTQINYRSCISKGSTLFANNLDSMGL